MLFVYDLELLADLNVHLLNSEAPETNVEKVVPSGIEIKRIEMLVIFGFDIERIKLFKQVVIIALGSFCVYTEDGFH